ncbi:hypothetical protein D9M73_172910 [compost metagenome]
MVRDVVDVPFQTMLSVVVASDIDDVINHLVGDVSRQNQFGLLTFYLERRLHEQRIVIANAHDIFFVALPEWRVNEEFDTIMCKIELRAQRPCVSDQVTTLFRIDVTLG